MAVPGAKPQRPTTTVSGGSDPNPMFPGAVESCEMKTFQGLTALSRTGCRHKLGPWSGASRGLQFGDITTHPNQIEIHSLLLMFTFRSTPHAPAFIYSHVKDGHGTKYPCSSQHGSAKRDAPASSPDKGGTTSSREGRGAARDASKEHTKEKTSSKG